MLDKVYIDRLKSGGNASLDAVLPSTFLDVDEPELQLIGEVTIEGKAYLSGDHLTLQLSAKTLAMLPCRICNQAAKVTVTVQNSCTSIALAEIKGAVFDPNELVREIILAEVPARAECQGNCPQRKELKPFLKEEEECYFPFKDLEEK